VASRRLCLVVVRKFVSVLHAHEGGMVSACGSSISVKHSTTVEKVGLTQMVGLLWGLAVVGSTPYSISPDPKTIPRAYILYLPYIPSQSGIYASEEVERLRASVNINLIMLLLSCSARPTKRPTGKIPLDERRYVPFSSVQSLYDCRAEVIVTHTPSTSDARETYAQPMQKFITNMLV
jgi:hypothetical protein